MSEGPDGLVAEHLLYAGCGIRLWLKNILNAIIDMEEIPTMLKSGLIVPVYKGGGRDHTSVHSYRGITLVSVIAKLLEILILERMQPGSIRVGHSSY